MPLRLDIKLTYQCNNHCRFCVQGSKRSEYSGFMPYDKVYALLKSKKRSYSEVVFTGGEPTLHPDFIRLIEAAKRLGYNVHIQTNGRIFSYVEVCLNAVRAGADIFAVSIHGHTPELHDALTRVPGSLRQSMRGIRNLLSLGKNVVTNTVINKDNYHFLPHIAKFLTNAGVRQYQISYPHIAGHAATDMKELVPRKSIVMPYVIKAIDFGIKNGYSPKIEAIPQCFLAEYGSCITDYDIPETLIYEEEGPRDFSRWRVREGKLTGPKCRVCKYFKNCEGPWKEYPQIFGWDEFVPVTVKHKKHV